MFIKDVNVDDEVTPTPQKEEIILLEPKDLKAIIQALLDLSYDKKTDVYQLPSDVLTLADELGLT